MCAEGRVGLGCGWLRTAGVEEEVSGHATGILTTTTTRYNPCLPAAPHTVRFSGLCVANQRTQNVCVFAYLGDRHRGSLSTFVERASE